MPILGKMNVIEPETAVKKDTITPPAIAFSILRTHTIGLIFLYINMPDISGISFAKSIDEGIKFFICLSVLTPNFVN